ncbi:MAG: glycosyltransferase family 39 protein [Bacteroidota bacterium]
MYKRKELLGRCVGYLMLIVLVGLVLRIFQHTFQSLWIDELVTMLTSDVSHGPSDIIELLRRNVHPPLYYLLLNGWFKTFGFTESAGRLFSAFAGAGGIVAIYFLGKEIRSRKVGLVAAMLVAINLFHLYYSQEVRSYALLFLLTTLSYLFFLRGLKRTHWKPYLLYTLLTTALIYTHYYGLFVLASHIGIFLFMAIWRYRDIQYWAYGLISGFAILGAYYSWISTLIKISGIKSIWISPPSPTIFAEYFYKHLGKDPFLAVVFLGLTLFFLYQMYKLRHQWLGRPLKEVSPLHYALILCAWVAATLGIPYVRSLISTPIMHYRYTMVALPALFIMVAWGWSLIRNARYRKMILGAVVLSTCLNMVFFNRYYERVNKEQWRQAAQLVLQENGENYPVISFWAKYYQFYFDQFNGAETIIDPRDSTFEEVLETADGFWLMTAHQGKLLKGNKAQMTVGQETLISEEFRVEKTHEFDGAAAYFYRRIYSPSQPEVVAILPSGPVPN